MRAVGRTAWFCLAALWCAGLLLPGSPAHAQPTAPDRAEAADRGVDEGITLRELFVRARRRSTVLDAARADVGVAEALRAWASVYPNPTVSYTNTTLLGGTNTTNGAQHSLTLTQPLYVGGQMGARYSSAEAGIDAARRQYRATESDLLAQARRLFVTLLVAQERVRLLESMKHDLMSVRETVKIRAEAGFKSRYDVQRIEAELAELTSRIEEANAACVATSGELASTLAIRDWRPRAVGEVAPLGVSTEVDELWRWGRAHHPGILAARAEQTAAVASTDVARAESWPDLALTAGAVMTTNDYSVAGIFGISWALPVFDRNQAVIGQAVATEHATALRANVAETKARGELQTSVDVLARRKADLARFQTEVIAGLPELRDLAQTAYRYGQATVLDLLDTFRTESDRRQAYLDKIEAVMQAEIDVLVAAGNVTWLP